MAEDLAIGYWAAQEQYPPDRLLQFAAEAEKGGFETVFSSDHFMPWFDTGGQSGFTWAWIAAAAAQTSKIRLGTGVTAPDRYHPAIIAQAFATLDCMFPGRIMLGLGAGEAMNSIPLGIVKPSPGQMALRLKDSLEIITRLWKGNFQDYSGFFYQLRAARLYTPPRNKIPIFVAAGGKRTAELAGTYADGVIGFSGGEEGRDVLLTAIDTAKKIQGKDSKTFGRLIEFKCSFAKDYDQALNSIKVWRSTMVQSVLSSDIADPRALENKGQQEVSDKKIEDTWTIVTNVEDLINPIEKLAQDGYNYIQVHSSSPDELNFVKEFTQKALPILTNTM